VSVGYWGDEKKSDLLRKMADRSAQLRTFYLDVAEDLDTLTSEWEHIARHLASICDAQDAREDVRPYIHQASAYLLAAGEREPSAPSGNPAAPIVPSPAGDATD